MIVKPGSGRDAEAVAATMSRAVTDLATQIATSLGAVVAIDAVGQSGRKLTVIRATSDQ
jgi:hypothetical protein